MTPGESAQDYSPAEWVERLAPFDGWNERLLLAAFAVGGVPGAYLDVGSGTGAMVNMARRLSVEAYGLDQTVRPDDWLRTVDLRQPYDCGRRFDLVTCLETAEHIPAEFAGVLADTIARHVNAGGWLYFTAAPPGQAGNGHENAQPAGYWRTLFWDRGLNWKEERTVQLAHVWDMLRSPLWWLPANLQVFKREH